MVFKEGVRGAVRPPRDAPCELPRDPEATARPSGLRARRGAAPSVGQMGFDERERVGHSSGKALSAMKRTALRRSAYGMLDAVLSRRAARR